MKDSIDHFPDYLYSINLDYCSEVPSSKQTELFIESLIDFLFPFRGDRSYSRDEISEHLDMLEKQLGSLLKPLKKNLSQDVTDICRMFFEQVPVIHKKLLKDAEAFSQFDPASESIEEIILCYPGFYSIATYRLAHELYLLEVPVLPRVMTEYAHGKTGVDIHPGAGIGESFFIDHGTGTVIGETAIIGNNVKVYQGVTLGALFVKKSLARQKRHPTIEDNVIIYARSTILGGKTVIGHDSVIGGNVWLTESVLPHSVVYQKHHVIVRDNKDVSDQLNWVI
jgi:serine O-acetyltransferase